MAERRTDIQRYVSGDAPDPESGSGTGRRPALDPEVMQRRLGGRFELLSALGMGGMGVVYRARERETGREVALKVLLESRVDERGLKRFEREGEVAAALDHPGIVRVHSAGQAGGLPFLAYELVQGARTLEDVLRHTDRGTLVGLVREAAEALGHAHAHGVVHRDVKPENLLVGGDGRLWVTDFGVASARSLTRLTGTGMLVGTPLYMAPEQIAGNRAAIGPATDVWALGVVLYEALCGRRPFDAPDLGRLTGLILSGSFRPPRAIDPSIPKDLEAICLRALRVDPRERYPDAQLLARRLSDHLSGTRSVERAPLSRRRVAAAGGAAAALLLAAGLVVALGRGAPSPPARVRVVLVSPASEAADTWEDHVTFAGRVEPPEAVVEVALGGRTRRLRGPELEARFPLRPGENRLRWRTIAAGEEGPWSERTLVRHAPPRWFRDQPSNRQPPLPLPDGVAFGDDPGRYVLAGDGSLLVWVPPGRFTIGSVDDPIDALPAREVTIARGFFMGLHEVTWAQYRRFCEVTRRRVPKASHGPADLPPVDVLAPGARPADFDDPVPAGPDHPAFNVGLAGARAYCAWAGARLPTEEEWEYAARGTDGRTFPWGNQAPDPERLNGEGAQDGHAFTAPVGSFPRGASPFGCLDMAGNVFEWVEPGPEGVLVCRGGSWYVPGWFSKTTYRVRAAGGWGGNDLGFRVCVSGGRSVH